MATLVVLVSNRDEDRKFCADLAKVLPAELRVASTAPELESFLQSNPISFIFLDGGFITNMAESQRKAIIHSIGSRGWAERVFIIADQPLSGESPYADAAFFGHYFVRRFDAPTPEIIRRLCLSGLSADIGNLSETLNRDGTCQKLVLAKNAQKPVAVEAINKTLVKRGLPERLCANVAKAADEILLNALYDAPKDAAGVSYRKAASAALHEEFFDLQGKEQITLEMCSHPDFFTVCVTDRFGSLERAAVQAMMKRDYQTTEFNVHAKGTGLGIHDIYKGGLSLLFAVSPGKETQAWIFVPLSTSYKAFRNSVHFFSFIVPAALHTR